MKGMRKSLLSKIPLLEADNTMFDVAKHLAESAIEYLIVGRTVKVDGKKVLSVYFFLKEELIKGNTKAQFRTFLNKTDYITQDLECQNIKWRTASFDGSFMYMYYCWKEKIYIYDNETVAAIQALVGNHDQPLQALSAHQNSIQKVRLAKKHKKITDRIDGKMSEIKALPKDFRRWIDKSALIKSRYIYYIYKSGKKLLDGYCTNCKKDVKVQGARHELEGVCPNCRSSIIFKAQGKTKHLTDRISVALLQETDNGFAVRYFSVIKKYLSNYRNPELLVYECSRDFYEGDKILSFERAFFKKTQRMRWCDYTRGNDNCARFAILYEKNVDDIIKNTKWKYSAIKLFASHEKGFNFHVYKYLDIYLKKPFIEYFVKAKLYKLAGQMLNSSYYFDFQNMKVAENLLKLLSIDKNGLKLLRDINGGTSALKLIQKAQNRKVSVTAEQIKFISTNFNYGSDIFKWCKYFSLHKILKYFEKQSHSYSNINNTLNDWCDYLENCQYLRYDLKNDFIFFPKNLIPAHDNVYKLVADKKNKIRARQKAKNEKLMKQIYDNLNHIANWQTGDYFIKLPASTDEIIHEGQELHHCVGGYVDSIVKKERLILFLRKKDEPDTPFFTVDVKNAKVSQCRGLRNCSMPPEINKVITKFEKEVLSVSKSKEAA